MRSKNLHNIFSGIAFVLFLLGTLPVLAQPLEVTDGVTNPYTPENLITNIFLGDGVEVLNVEFQGIASTVGYFQDGIDEIGIDRGLVMTSGGVSSGGGQTGIDNPGSAFASVDVNSPATDPDMVTIGAPNAPNDVCKYLITFIPTADTLRFNYVFASEEYPEYACSSFNDIFGFFISGPGINGSYENNAENIAIIPGTNLPVTINNLHPANGTTCPPSFDEFYNNNNGSNNLPVYDGFTDVFTAQAVVIPCSTYTIKLVISDVGDGIFDSGVFLEAKSFGTGSLEVDIVTASLDGTITEGCSNASLCFSLPNPAESDFPVDYNVFGSATNGVDYSAIPLDLMIPQGDSSVCVDVTAFEDGITEGLEFIGIDVQRDICNRDTFYIYIRENELIPPDLGPDLMLCQGDSVQLDGTINIPLPPPPSFTNEQDVFINPPETSIFSSIDVVGVQPFELGPGVIQSVCVNIDHNWLSDLDLFLVAPSGLFMQLSTDNGSNGDDMINTCFTPTATTPIDYISPPASGAPYTGEFAPEGVWADLWGAQENPTNGEWSLLMIDDQNGFAGTLQDWTITFEPLYQIYYEWTPSAGLSCDDCPDPFAFPDTTTTYYLTAYDSYGCEVYDSITITVDEILPAPAVSCGTITNDCITFVWDPIPGATGYLVNVDSTFFSFSNGDTSHTVCNLTFEQTVNIQVLGIDDCNGMIGTASCTTPECDGAMPTVEAITGVSCFGDTDGVIELSATGPLPPFTFSLGGQTNDTGIFQDLAGGIYTITVTNAAPCGITIDVEVPEPDELSLNDIVLQEVSCNNATDGVGVVQVFGGTAPFSYVWSSGSTDSTATNLGAGMYTVDVTDANGCTASTTLELTNPDALELFPTSTVVSCNGDSTGTASIVIAGGVEPYSIQWDANAFNQTGVTADSLPAGTYTVVVTDANNCTETATVTVDENSPIELTFSTEGASCDGLQNGSATVQATGGGIEQYIYFWDANANNQFSQTAIDLPVGTYSVTVTNLLGCQAVGSVTVDAPNALVNSIIVEPTSCNDAQDGVAMVTTSGGQPGYTYQWSDGIAGPNMRDDLPAGTYTVTVEDDNGCAEVINFEILAPEELTISLSATEVDCASGNDGTATVVVTGGTGAYSFLWDDQQNDSIAVNLPAGEITVVVTDANGCEATGTVEVVAPDVIQLQVSSQPADCFESSTGTATVTPTGGAGGYTYLWNDPASQATPTAIGLAAGNYTVTVTDLNMCATEISVDVTEPTELTNSMNGQNLSCGNTPDGTATATPAGGTMPYSYAWSNGQNGQTATSLNIGLNFVTITDDNGCELIDSIELFAPEALEISLAPQMVSCNSGADGQAAVTIITGTAPFQYAWSNGQNQAIAAGLAAGSYTVTVTDASNCEAVASITINEPAALNATLTQTPASCFNGGDGSATVTAINYGATPADINDFTFAWSVPGQVNATLPNLTGGVTYTVTITDPLGCELVESITIGNPTQVQASVSNTVDVSCAAGEDGQATVTASGGAGNYTFIWDGAAGGQTGATATNLSAGSYNVTIQDANGCQRVTSVTIEEPSPLSLSFERTHVECYGESTGTAEVAVEGGTAPYSVNWSNGATEFNAEDLAAGLYTATITDANGCEILDEVTITQPDQPLLAAYSTEDASCFGSTDGRITLDASGGTAPYRYSLDGENFVGTDILVAIEPGSYNVVVEDARGCQYVTADIFVNEPDPLQVDLGADIEIQFGEVVEFAPVIVSTNPIATYTWTPTGPGELTCYDCFNPSTLDSIDNQTTFLLEIEDINGCTAEDRVTIRVRKTRRVLVPTAFSPNGDGSNDRLLVHGLDGTTIRLFQVFDRWGDLVYQGGNFPINDPDSGWDGSFRGLEMSSGVYIWYLEVEYIDGREEAFKGSTTLVR